MPRVVTNVFKQTLRTADFSLADKDISTTGYTLVGEYTIGAQREVAIGITESAQGALQGRCAYIRLDNTGAAQITGLIRVKVVDAHDEGKTRIDATQDEWDASKTDRTQCLLLPEDTLRGVEDSKVQIWMKADTTNTNVTLDADDADTIIQLPVTIYTVRRT